MKDIPEFEGLYAITKDGSIWSYPKVWKRRNGTTSKHDGKWMSLWLHNAGYLGVDLRDKRGVKRKFLVHRLVALTYIGIPKRLEVNHKNGNKKDNSASNLEWVTSSQNSQHAEQNGWLPHKRGAEHKFAKLNEEKVAKIRLLTVTHSNKEIASMFGVNSGVISRVVNRKAWRHVP